MGQAAQISGRNHGKIGFWSIVWKITQRPMTIHNNYGRRLNPVQIIVNTGTVLQTKGILTSKGGTCGTLVTKWIMIECLEKYDKGSSDLQNTK